MEGAVLSIRRVNSEGREKKIKKSQTGEGGIPWHCRQGRGGKADFIKEKQSEGRKKEGEGAGQGLRGKGESRTGREKGQLRGRGAQWETPRHRHQELCEWGLLPR